MISHLLLLVVMASTKYIQCPSSPEKICPNPILTPGAVTAETTSLLCDPNWNTSRVRNVTEHTKRMVCEAYGFTKGCPGPGYEIDHLVPIEVGGSNVVNNLWPQPIDQARVKDKVENRLHRLVCDGKIELPDAQKGIASDWWLMTTTMPLP